jgi:hypothetical protein
MWRRRRGDRLLVEEVSVGNYWAGAGEAPLDELALKARESWWSRAGPTSAAHHLALALAGGL